jgi:L-lactate dehydrogenase complex protein LldG
VPGCRLCIVYVAKVVELVAEASPAWQRAGGPPLTWISGPSATSDLELKRAESVHARRALEVVLAGL